MKWMKNGVLVLLNRLRMKKTLEVLKALVD